MVLLKVLIGIMNRTHKQRINIFRLVQGIVFPGQRKVGGGRGGALLLESEELSRMVFKSRHDKKRGGTSL